MQWCFCFCCCFLFCVPGASLEKTHGMETTWEGGRVSKITELPLIPLWPKQQTQRNRKLVYCDSQSPRQGGHGAHACGSMWQGGSQHGRPGSQNQLGPWKPSETHPWGTMLPTAKHPFLKWFTAFPTMPPAREWVPKTWDSMGEHSLFKLQQLEADVWRERKLLNFYSIKSWCNNSGSLPIRSMFACWEWRDTQCLRELDAFQRPLVQFPITHTWQPTTACNSHSRESDTFWAGCSAGSWIQLLP